MKVKIHKVKEKDVKSWWRLRPRIPKSKQNILQEEPCKVVFSLGVIEHLWFSNIIIGDRYVTKKPVEPSFTSKVLDLSYLLEETKENKT